MGEGYIKQPFVVEDGYVALPQGPGLGIELDDAAIDQKLGHTFRNPPLFHSDGSVAEW
ncbi:MAG TPA: enolase C-terminal domain-like protein [Armatimonadota bacterium]|nr:enolase C-terminal domain-like protein [Armatimonadota bacterium]